MLYMKSNATWPATQPAMQPGDQLPACTALLTSNTQIVYSVHAYQLLYSDELSLLHWQRSGFS